jgi:hypothetical protein
MPVVVLADLYRHLRSSFDAIQEVSRMHPVRRCSGASKKPPFGGRPACVSSSIVALSGLLPSPTQMAPNNRELNKYEAYEGEVRIGRHVGLCLSSRASATCNHGTGFHGRMSTSSGGSRGARAGGESVIRPFHGRFNVAGEGTCLGSALRVSCPYRPQPQNGARPRSMPGVLETERPLVMDKTRGTPRSGTPRLRRPD